MVIYAQGRIEVGCDDPRHVGQRRVVLNYGAAWSALDALKRTGWQWSAKTQKLRCPECVAIQKARG